MSSKEKPTQDGSNQAPLTNAISRFFSISDRSSRIQITTLKAVCECFFGVKNSSAQVDNVFLEMQLAGPFW